MYFVNWPLDLIRPVIEGGYDRRKSRARRYRLCLYELFRGQLDNWSLHTHSRGYTDLVPFQITRRRFVRSGVN